jgi:hypothetical protein
MTAPGDSLATTAWKSIRQHSHLQPAAVTIGLHDQAVLDGSSC